MSGADALSDAALAAQAHEVIDEFGGDMRYLPELEAEIAAGFRAIRDAATAAERGRAIAIVERQPNYPDTYTGMRQQWVKDSILAALRAVLNKP